MIPRLSFLACALAMATTGQAKTSVSLAMAQCSALFDVVHIMSEVKETRARAQIAAHVWIHHAATHAQADRLRVDQLRLSRRRDWVTRGHIFVQSSEFRNWADYCAALALEHDVRYIRAN